MVFSLSVGSRLAALAVLGWLTAAAGRGPSIDRPPGSVRCATVEYVRLSRRDVDEVLAVIVSLGRGGLFSSKQETCDLVRLCNLGFPGWVIICVADVAFLKTVTSEQSYYTWPNPENQD
ncbi:hypothetical protein C0J52_15305 [Blattella germanica]|nr:hypothetical protein C0J52_15305 [Blattella germanica]